MQTDKQSLSHIRTTYKQFGFYGFCKRAIKAVLRKIYIEWESFNYYEIDISRRIDVIKEVLSKYNFNVMKLSLDDFAHGDKDIFNSKKMSVLKDRFSKDSYEAYGIFDGDELVFSAWISLDEFVSSVKELGHQLDSEEVLLLDSYCNPSHRGKGLQNYMVAYRLFMAYKKEKKKGVTLALTENTPTNKAQLKSGFEKAFKYTTIIVFGHLFTDFNSKKKKYLDSLR